MKNNYYDILGVDVNSEMSEIKSAYRNLARKYHPDMKSGDVEKFKAVNEAYSTLSDERKRMQYDMLFGFYRTKPNPNDKDYSDFSTQNFTNNTKKTEYTEKTQKTEKNEQSKKTDNEFTRTTKQKSSEKNFFEEIFSSKNDKKIPQNGSNLTTEISISMSEAKYGTTKIINILHTEQCPKCKGRKFINSAYCYECNGTGEKTKQRKLSVKIPAGIKNETKLRVKGEGNIGKNGGNNGDLFIIVKIEGNQNIRYEGQNIHYNVPIEPHEAVLGTTISINSVEGFISIKIPPRTKSGQKFRIQQHSGGKIFEIFVTVHIEIPAYLSDDEIKLYEKLKKLSNNNLRENFVND